jgi:hypothetical protein
MATAPQNRREGLTEPTRRGEPEHWLLAGHYDPDFVSEIESELDRLSRLPIGWDGYGSPVIDPGIIAAARKFIAALPENLAYRPLVVPMSGGNLQFEWHHGPKILELEFENAQTIRYAQWHPQAQVEEEDAIRATDVGKAVALIQWFMSGTTCI